MAKKAAKKSSGGSKSAKSARGAAATKKAAKGARGAATKSAKSVKSAKTSRSVKSAKSAKPARSAKAAKPAAKKKAGRSPNAAFMAPVTPSPALAAVVGDKPMPRTAITSALWAYIKKNNLQDQKNRRMINADAALKTVFGGKATVNMFDMTKLVGKHLS